MGEIARHADQEVGEGGAGFGSIDIESSVECRIGMLVHLVPVKLAAKFQGVRSDHLRHRVTQIERVVDLGFIGDGNTHYEGRKNDIFHAFKLRRLNREAGNPVGHEALRRLAHSEPAMRLPNHIGITEIPRVEFIDRAGPENLRVSQADELRTSECQRVKARYARSTLLSGIGIVEPVIVKKIVCGKLAPSAALASIRPEDLSSRTVCG